ncbi:MAG TPA: ubiquinol-cytochrome c reductase iron-sulfur subunit [Candidatus Limnocylindrales bacterium]|nr:ubiquinol-cytochrome c reductase iron-sulfur subunit [Candidatus Limnocylindrales bacterium]
MVGLRRLVEDSREMSRRSFLALLGWGAFVVASLAALVQSIRFMQPNALYEDPAAFKAGAPADYPVGSTTVITDKRVVINRDPDGFYAISLICTHLGCTPRYFSDVTSDLVQKGIGGLTDPATGQSATQAHPDLPGFKCPCHGSRYYRDAINFYGPAPRPMDRISIVLSKDDKLFIDRSIVVDRSYRLKV